MTTLDDVLKDNMLSDLYYELRQPSALSTFKKLQKVAKTRSASAIRM